MKDLIEKLIKLADKLQDSACPMIEKLNLITELQNRLNGAWIEIYMEDEPKKKSIEYLTRR